MYLLKLVLTKAREYNFMQRKRQFPDNYWRGLLIVLTVYTIVQLLYYHPVLKVPAFLDSFRQIIRWLTICIVYLSGIFVLQKTGVVWLKWVWHLIHLLLIVYLLLIAFTEYLVAPVSYGIRASVAPVIEFLISPLLYMGMGVVYKSLNGSYRNIKMPND